MKKLSFIPLSVIAAIIVVISCKKGVIDYGDSTKITADQAALKINYVSQYASNPLVVFKINDIPVSAPISARTPFPGGGYNTGGNNTSDYLIVNSGQVKLSVVIPKKKYDGTDSVVLYTTTFQLEAGKNYSAHITDTAAATKSLLTVENLARPDTTISRFHFVNLMPNVPAIDLYYGVTAATATDQSTDSLLVNNIGFLQNSGDFTIKVSGANKVFKVRAAGAAKTAATVITSYTTTSVPSNQRVFTAFASGYNGKVAPSTQRPYISFFLVK